MKFTKGRWMYREGITASHVGQIRDIRTEGNKICLYTVPYIADKRGMGGPTIEIYLSSPQPNVIRLEAYHYLGIQRKIPTFEINDANLPLTVEDTETTITVKSGDLELVIAKRPCDFSFYYKGRKLTNVEHNPTGLSMISTIHSRDEDYMRQQMDLDFVDIRSSATKTNSFMSVRMGLDLAMALPA